MTAITRIIQRLSSRPADEINLHLSQFGFHVVDEYATLIEALGNGSDEDLEQLDAFLFGHDPEPDEHQLPWRGERVRLFISHLSSEKVYVSEIARELRPFGIQAFVAHEDIEPGREWQQVILNSLRTCDALVAMLHNDFHQSNWTDQEVGFVLGRGRPVFSVRLGGSPYGFFGSIQAINGNGKSAEQVASDIYDVLRADARVGPPLQEGLITALAEAGSYMQAGPIAKRLENGPMPTEAQFIRLLEIREQNANVAKCWAAEGLFNKLTTEYLF